jgi:hypothetical protein
LRAGQRGLAAFAVGIGDAQRVAAGGARDVGDARGVDAALAGQLLVDRVGDAVRRQPQVVRRHRQRLAQHLAALDHVPQLVADVEAAVGQPVSRAGDQCVGAAAAPVGELRGAGLVERAAGIDDAEQPAALEVGAHDRRQRLAAAVLVAEAGDRHRQLRRTDAGDLDPELREGGRGQTETGGQRRVEASSLDGHRVLVGRGRPSGFAGL